MIRARTVSQGTVRTRPAAKSRDLLSSSPAHAAATSSSGSSRLTNNSSATRARSWRGRRRTSASNSSVDTDPTVPPGSGLNVRTHQAVLLALYRLLRGGGVRRLREQTDDRRPPPRTAHPVPASPRAVSSGFVDRTAATNRDHTSFGTAGLDFDHDGRLDVLVAGRRGAPAAVASAAQRSGARSKRSTAFHPAGQPCSIRTAMLRSASSTSHVQSHAGILMTSQPMPMRIRSRARSWRRNLPLASTW